MTPHWVAVGCSQHVVQSIPVLGWSGGARQPELSSRDMPLAVEAPMLQPAGQLCVGWVWLICNSKHMVLGFAGVSDQHC